jgi:hypothetical protein
MTNSKLLLGILSLTALTHLTAGEASLFAADERLDPDEAILREARIGCDDASLIDFLRQQGRPIPEPAEITKLVGKLASDEFEERERAADKLIAVGFPAIPFLRRAMTDDKPEIARRAKGCIEKINERLALPAAAVRVVARRKPKGAVEAVLGYLPKVADEKDEEDAWYCLEAVAVRDGKVDPALAAALKDEAPSRRAIAACILGRLGDREQRDTVRKLLKDAEPEVRLRAAQGLIAAKDKTAVPTLIELLGADSTAISWQAEELLHWVSGGKGPKPTVGSGTPERKKECRSAWDAWWGEKEDKIDAADFGKGCNRPGLMIVGEFEDVSSGANLELRSLLHLYGCDDRPRWQLEDAPVIRDFQLLPGPRLLLVEGKRAERITERDLGGKVSWKKEFDAKVHAFSCQRLSNGNTFIHANLLLLEVDADGNELYRVELPVEVPRADGPGEPWRAQKLDNGHILGLTRKGCVTELEAATGKELHSFRLEIGKSTNCDLAAILSDGHFLMGAEDRDEIVETDALGRKLASYKWPAFQHAVRLRNGHTLVVGRSAGTIRVFEIDRAGKKIHETVCARPPYQIRVCLGLVRFGFDDIESSTP